MRLVVADYILLPRAAVPFRLRGGDVRGRLLRAALARVLPPAVPVAVLLRALPSRILRCRRVVYRQTWKRAGHIGRGRSVHGRSRGVHHALRQIHQSSSYSFFRFLPSPNKALQPTPIVHRHSACAVQVQPAAWLSLVCSAAKEPRTVYPVPRQWPKTMCHLASVLGGIPRLHGAGLRLRSGFWFRVVSGPLSIVRLFLAGRRTLLSGLPSGRTNAAEQPAAREPELRLQLWRTLSVILGVLSHRRRPVMRR